MGAHLSRFLRSGGFTIIEGAASPEHHSALLTEALQLYPGAREERVEESDREEIRGGSPARRFLTAAGGSAQECFYQSRSTIETLETVTGFSLIQTGQYGTYIFYARPGDHISVHRDMELCDLVSITCLCDESAFDQPGGLLYIYPTRLRDPLSTIRNTSHQGAWGVRLKPGQTAVLLGGYIPHGTIPLSSNQLRIVSVLCYRLLPS
jgi:hypothetical protein